MPSPTDAFQVSGTNAAAPFTLKVHRGDGMALVAMNWKTGSPPDDFVGFAIEYREPGGHRFYSLKNRLAFPGVTDRPRPNALSTRLSPIQKFRWVHFPRNADLDGLFTYRVTPVFMNEKDELSYGEMQEASLALRRDTYPGQLNVAFTRGFVSSQAFVDRYVTARHGLDDLLPADADAGLSFAPTHPEAAEACRWMGFEARQEMLDLLDEAIADGQTRVSAIAYDLNLPEVVTRLERLGTRLRVIVDDSKGHGEPTSAESIAAGRLAASAGAANVRRQHMGQLQHNKLIIVDGPRVQAVLCGSTNFSWRGVYVQANNALVARGRTAVRAFARAFDSYWASDRASAFGTTRSAAWTSLGIKGVSAKVAFSPHAPANALLDAIAEDIRLRTRSSLLYSLAFLAQTRGSIPDAIEEVANRADRFVFGVADRRVSGITLRDPKGNVAPMYPASLSGDLPEPFRSEPTGLAGGVGTRMHHKFVVIDFDKPSARVYLGSYNFSHAADDKNGDHLLLIRDRRVAVSYMIEGLRLFDHYQFRVLQQSASTRRKQLALRLPPRKAGETAWWSDSFTQPHKVRDRLLFA